MASKKCIIFFSLSDCFFVFFLLDKKGRGRFFLTLYFFRNDIWFGLERKESGARERETN